MGWRRSARTAYGDSGEFACERGTVPQGGVESCLVFVAVVDWMLAAVKAASESPVQVPVDEEEQVAVDATVFADDVSLYQTDCVAGQKVMRGIERRVDGRWATGPGEASLAVSKGPSRSGRRLRVTRS